MNVLSVFSFVKGEEYGSVIGDGMDAGLSLEEAINEAYQRLGVIPLWKLYSSMLNPVFLSAMGGVISGLHGHKIGLWNQRLLAALIKVTKEMG